MAFVRVRLIELIGTWPVDDGVCVGGKMVKEPADDVLLIFRERSKQGGIVMSRVEACFLRCRPTGLLQVDPCHTSIDRAGTAPDQVFLAHPVDQPGETGLPHGKMICDFGNRLPVLFIEQKEDGDLCDRKSRILLGPVICRAEHGRIGDLQKIENTKFLGHLFGSYVD